MANSCCDLITTKRDLSTNTVDYHRHCQATVLSANGTGSGNGLSWDCINNLTLSNLPSNWKSYFTVNHENITQDLAAILKLMNALDTGGTTVSFTRNLTSGQEIGTITIDGNSTKIYAPSAVSVSQTQTSGTQIATINGTPIYAPSVSAGSTVRFTQTQTSGTKLGTIVIDGSSKDIYAPEISFTQDQSSGTQIGILSINGTEHKIYAPISENSGSVVTYTQNFTNTNGAKIGTISINGTTTNIYAPTVSFTRYQTSENSIKIGSISINGSSTDIYAPKSEGSGSTVSFSQTLSSGTEVGQITIDGTTTIIYAPTQGTGGSTVSFTGSISSGTKIGSITINETTTDIYAPSHTKTDVYFSPATLESKVAIGSLVVDGKSTQIYAPTAGASVSSVSVTQTITSGDEIGVIDVSGNTKKLYAKTVTVTPNGSSGNKVANITVGSTSKDIYAPKATVHSEYTSSNGTKIATVDDTAIYAPTPTSVSVTQTITSGDEIGEIDVSGNKKKLYAKTVTVTPNGSSGNKVANITVGSISKDIYAPKATVSSEYTSSTGTKIATVDDTAIYAPTSSIDWNVIPAKSESGTTITPSKDYHIYRMSVSKNSFSPTISMSNYTSNASDIISFELHVKNTGSSNATMTTPSVSGFTITSLTDQNYVTSGKTNVWVFRFDMSTKKASMSLAYVY